MVTTYGGIYANKQVWLSGITGFKGAWLAEWLLQLGAKVTGFALDPPTAPSLFQQLGLADRIDWHRADLQDAAAVKQSILSTQPDFVFHLAAQPLVRLSYLEPLLTYNTNVMGTIHVLEALRSMTKSCAAVMVTTDKCYENQEWQHGYRECDPMGGHDPYSSSKGMAELAISAYRRSFFKNASVKIASARAGNVLGGGDWAADRIIPDSVRNLRSDAPIPVRNKTARRPWQHVLDPLSGYLWLASKLKTESSGIDQAFNFGPPVQSNKSVLDIVTEILKHWPGTWEDASDPQAPHEANLLHLNTDKAYAVLGWQPVWDFSETIACTVNWYQDQHRGADPLLLTRNQIHQFTEAGRMKCLPWATPTT